MELIKVEKDKQDEQVAIILKESQRQKEELQKQEKGKKDTDGQLFSQVEALKTENVKLVKSIDDLQNEAKAK